MSLHRSTQVIRREAEQLLKAAGVTGAPVALRDVISYLNLSLVERAREPFSSEAALVPLGDGHAIELRGTSSARRQRFTIAHEIGHFLLHPGRAVAERGGATNRATASLEREANEFAAELLMPERLVRQAALEEGADARRLADRFDVSAQAMNLRLRRLGLVERQSDPLPPSRGVV
jgi:predicted transcriptional regulator